MTVPATDRRAGPFLGTGVIVALPFDFKVFDDEDLVVTHTADDGVETVLALGSDYTVTLNPDQDTAPGGDVTPLSTTYLDAGSTITLTSGVDYDQTLNLLAGGNFSPRAIENAFDRTVIQIQQTAEQLGRTLQAPVAFDGDPTLPAPEAGSVFGWNATADGIVNINPATLASIVAYANWRTDIFDGTGAQTVFTLTTDPGVVHNCDVSISGVAQAPGVGFTVSGTTLTFASAPAAGTGNVVVRYGEALPQGTVNANQVTFEPDGGGSVDRTAEAVLREMPVSVAGYGVIGDGVTDDTAALEVAVTANAGRMLLIPAGFNCLLASEFDITASGVHIVGYGATITKGATFTGSCAIRVSATDVTLEGFEIDGTDQADDGIITGAGAASGFTAKNLVVRDCLYGISANSNSNVTLDGCEISACASGCARVHNIAGGSANTNIEITRCSFDSSAETPSSSTQVSLLVRGDETYPTTKVFVEGNRFAHCVDPTNSGALCCEMRFVDGAVFDANRAFDGAMMVSVAASKNVAVAGNVGIGQTFYSIEVASVSSSICSDVTVTGNTIRGNGILNYGIGIQGNFAGCVGAVISGNAISGIVSYGVLVNDVWDDVTITGNRISYSNAAASQYAIYINGSTTRQIDQITISGNQINGGGVAEKAVFLRNCSNAAVSGNTAPGFSEHGVYISVDSTVTVNDISISGNMLTPSGANAIGKSVSGTMGDRVTARANAGYRLTNTVGTDILNYNLDVYEAWGVNAPESNVTASPSSVYHRSSGGAGTSLYVKESGTGNTGWVGK